MTDKESAAFKIVTRLVANGNQALYAGGYVRDMHLASGAVSGDIDIATDAPPSMVSSLFDRIIPVGEHFGVLIVIQDSIPFEVATFRSDSGYADGRHPESVTFTTPQEDALRRDFTINGMFYDPIKGVTLDFVDGLTDLKNGIVRAIGDPAQRFAEDNLRLMRAVRFAARFGFRIEEQTWSAIRENAAGINRISHERIFQELDKMLLGPHPEVAFKLLNESGLLRQVLPEVAALAGLPQPPEFHPEGDVLIHTLLAVSLLNHPTQPLAWSTLLHDIGKAATFSRTDRIRFNNHHRVGADMASIVLKRLHASNALIDTVYECVDNHMNFMNVHRMRTARLKRFLSRPTMDLEMQLHRIDCLASHSDLELHRFCSGKLAEYAASSLKPVPFITGKDLIRLGLKPGPLFGAILEDVYDLQLEDTLCNRDDALDWVAKKYVSGLPFKPC